MAVLTATDFANQMVAQARVLDPSFSGEIGTPERKLIDAVAQSLADNQVDLTGLSGALDIDSKFGSNLDQFTSLFGMQRQQPVEATGFVQFSRSTPAPSNITIPTGVTLQATSTDPNQTATVQFMTTASGTIAQSSTTSNFVPIQAMVSGTIGNVAADTITQIASIPPPSGVTAVTNPNALTSGANMEDDNSFKVRFKNTWARNLAGTTDQYLSLALAGPYTTKATAVGAQSRFQEYIQVPSYDDAGFVNGTQNTAQTTYGTANMWTTALSIIPYAKQVYTTTQQYASNGQAGTAEFFYTPNVDFIFNYPPLLQGDALRDTASTTTSGSQTLPVTTLTVSSTTGFTASGSLMLNGYTLAYTAKTATSFTGVTGGGAGTVAAGTVLYQVPAASVQPNWTFINVFNPSAPQSIPGLQALAPQNVVLTEFSYVSQSSRNDLSHNVTNAVDVFVDGANPTTVTEITLPNVSNTIFNINPNSPWYYENYRRDGQPTKRPQIGNYITPLFQQPVVSLPPSITLNGFNYILGTDYWLVHEEADSMRNSVRSRDGIEWNVNSNDGNGHNIWTASQPGTTPVVWLEVDNYEVDANVATLQAAMESSAQIGTDVLVHSATTRYFKLDVTVMYSANSNPVAVNSAIATSLQQYFDSQYFGTVVQLSDLLEIIHETPGVDNVRWSNDLPIIPDLIRVYETDVNGKPLHGASIDRWQYGSSTLTEKHSLYITGYPFGISSVNNAGGVAAVNGSYTAGTLTIAVNNTSGFTPGMTLQVGGSNSDVATIASIAGTNVTLNYGLAHSHNVGDPVLAAQVDTFTLGYSGFTTKPIPLINPDGSSIASTMGTNAISAAILASSTGAPYTGLTVALDNRPITNVSQPIISFTITYGSNGAVLAPTVTNTVTASTRAYDTDFFLNDHTLPSLPSGAITGDTLPGLIIRQRAQNTFMRPGLV